MIEYFKDSPDISAVDGANLNMDIQPLIGIASDNGRDTRKTFRWNPMEFAGCARLLRAAFVRAGLRRRSSADWPSDRRAQSPACRCRGSPLRRLRAFRCSNLQRQKWEVFLCDQKAWHLQHNGA